MGCYFEEWRLGSFTIQIPRSSRHSEGMILHIYGAGNGI